MEDKMIPNKLIEFNLKLSFKNALGSGNIPKDAIVFIRESGEIYTNGVYYTNYQEIKDALFGEGDGSVNFRLKKLKDEVLGGVSEKLNTLKKIENFLDEFQKSGGGIANLEEGEGITLEDDEETGKKKVSVKVDGVSIVINEENSLSSGEISGGVF